MRFVSFVCEDCGEGMRFENIEVSWFAAEVRGDDCRRVRKSGAAFAKEVKELVRDGGG
jgi:hypothetical protein